MSLNHSQIHDLIARAKLADPLTLKSYPGKVVSREEALALEHVTGDIVKDKVTGKGGEVIGGTRATVTTG